VRRLYPENWFAPLGMAVLFAATEKPVLTILGGAGWTLVRRRI